ncbi:hypothetical protein K7432_012925 [Basidiobolus ranarum]|uniref:NAD(P)-binding domain-containing protein n=1 Tax=Basidiobolus ranarum TaxID=34480 RepID=A0ABR2VRJ0_9FUNG
MEKIYVIGATGKIGQEVVRGRLSNGIPTTVFARREEKHRRLFGESEHLSFVQGDYQNMDGFRRTIKGHTRLFLLISDFKNMAIHTSAFAKLSYDAGVSQIVHISSIGASLPWRAYIIGTLHRDAEESILAIPNRGAYVALRPASFFSNQYMGDANTIKSKNMIFGTASGDETKDWISTKDISDLALVILQDPIEKHGDAVYEMSSEAISGDDRAKLLSKALGRTITYATVDLEQEYNKFLSLGFPHSLAYAFSAYNHEAYITPALSLLLGRKPESMEDWFLLHKERFL